MVDINAESQTWGARRPEERTSESQNFPASEARVRGDSSGVEDIGFGAAREGGEEEGSSGSTIGGKIVAQLIQEAEDQLGTARECIDWYQREEEKILLKLDRLRRLLKQESDI